MRWQMPMLGATAICATLSLGPSLRIA